MIFGGWNTDGNTLGTVVGNSVVLHYFSGTRNASIGNSYFNSLRLLEDDNWQADVRQDLENYIYTVEGIKINIVSLILYSKEILQIIWNQI